MEATLEVLDTPQVQAGVRPLTRLAAGLSALLTRPWFYYVTLLALQLKRIWGIWDYREMTGGDTCAYFLSAYDWYWRWKTNFVWSPLYTSFYGTFLYITEDAAAVTVMHRIVIVLAATTLVLAVLRKMLPAELAWLIGVWWAVLPINFNTMYEVHLFGLLPLLTALLLVMSNRGPWARGAAVAVLVLNTLVVRNETIVAAVCLVAVCFWWERRQYRKASSGSAPTARNPLRPIVIAVALLVLGLLSLSVRQNGFWLLLVIFGLAAGLIAWDRALRRASTSSRPALSSLVMAYALPVILAFAVSAFFYHQSIIKRERLRAQVRDKHTVNMGQVYAFGYQQRHPRKWRNYNPWVDFPALCKSKFGAELPTIGQMIRSNPLEVTRHVLWNFRLVPNGVQLMLFNGIAGQMNPDYDSTVSRGRMDVMVLSIVTLVVVIAGVVLLRRNREFWWRHWIEPRQMGWLAMLCLAATAMVVIASQRPRPSYLFSLTVLLMICIGMAVFIIAHQFPRLRRFRVLLPLLMVLLPVVVPSHWADAKPPGPFSLLRTYARLRPYQSFIDQKDRVFLAGDHGPHFHNYLGYGHGRATLDYGVFAKLTPEVTLAQFLDSQAVTLFYLDSRYWGTLDDKYPGLVRDFILTSDATGWRMLAAGEHDDRWQGQNDGIYQYKWALFLRTKPGDAAAAETSFDAFPGSNGFSGWYPLGGFQAPEGPYPRANIPLVRWGLGPVSRLATQDTRGGTYRLELCGMTPAQNQHVTIKADGKPIKEFDLPAGTWPEMGISLDLAPGHHEIEFHYTAWQSPTPTHHQAVLFKELRIVRSDDPP